MSPYRSRSGLRSIRRIATLATATALAVGALTGAASAAAPAANHPTAARISPVTAPAPTLNPSFLSAQAQAAARQRAHTVSGRTAWAPSLDLGWQDYSGSIVLDGGDLPADSSGYHQVTLAANGTPQVRELLDLGSVTGTSGEHDVLAVQGNGVQVLYGYTNGATSSTSADVGSGWQTYSQLLVAGDVNGDGHVDLYARDHAGNLYFYAGTGSLTSPFQARVLLGSGWNMYSQLVGLAGGVVGRDSAGALWLYKANADGSLSARKPLSGGATGWNQYVQLMTADINGDGSADLIGRTAAGVLYGYTYDPSTGTLGAAQNIGSGWYGITTAANQGLAPLWGKGGLMARTSAGALKWYGAYGNGTLAPGEASGSGWDTGYAPIVTAGASLTNSGLSDLVATDKYGDLMTSESLNNNQPVQQGKYYTAVVGPGDLNGDGYSDLLVRNGSGNLYLAPGAGTGYFPQDVYLGGGWNIYTRIIGAGDLTGDGVPDIVGITAQGDAYLYPGLGNGKFGARHYVGSGWNYARIAAVGDLNSDGVGDLVAIDSAGKLWGYDGNGHGGFNSRNYLGYGWNAFASIG